MQDVRKPQGANHLEGVISDFEGMRILCAPRRGYVFCQSHGGRRDFGLCSNCEKGTVRAKYVLFVHCHAVACVHTFIIGTRIE